MTPFQMIREAAEAADKIGKIFPQSGFAFGRIICTGDWISVACSCKVRLPDYTEAVFGGHRTITYQMLELCKTNILLDALENITAQTLRQVREFTGDNA